jgi:hypothetical protein
VPLYVKGARTKTGCEELRIEVGQELLALCIELAHSGDNIAGRTNTDNLHNSLENQQREIEEIRMRAVLVPEYIEHAIVAVLVGLGGHGDELGRRCCCAAQAQGLRSREERHCSVPVVLFVWQERGSGNTGVIVKRKAS